MLSVLIPSRCEPFLFKTVSDILAKAEGDIEIIVVLDGYWTKTEKGEVPLVGDPRVHYIHRGEAMGMRAGINAAAALARGEFIMKIDAHCMVDQGFDVKLAADCEDDWVVIPRRKRLDADKWEIQDAGKPDVDYMYLAYADNPNDFGGPGLNGKNWDEKNRDESLRGILIDDVMSAQGSCWFMKKTYYEFLELMDEENYGTFWNEAQEIMLKAWLSGGRCVVNKKTWYAHLHKGKTHGRGYPLAKTQLEKGATYTKKWFTVGAAWKKQTLPLEWLILKFNPPGWPDPALGYGRYNVENPDPVIQEYVKNLPTTPTKPMPETVEATLDETNGPTLRVLPKFKRGDLARKFAEFGFTKGAEIGVADGRYSETLCKAIPKLQLTCVDPWAAYPENPRYHGYSRRDGGRPNEELARERMAPYGARMLKTFSMEAVRQVPDGSLDFVYIDGHHSFDYVMQDVIEWAKKVRKGGVVAGHDFYNFRDSGVIEAVSTYVKAHDIPEVFLTDEREPTWYFIKP